ncbi:hypothetical protein CWO84_21310 [Methylomonas sp. Kb3]|uniref:hypothetical protein n=1 Tax=Methylomonas sp. Kb3 TaxID=1611544 RepID=UPI000C34BCFE|nr:hypothetical protein [Methylomonas sp. Kb3]PKD37798.1 hypothetical protein CWO84_21310 [Methylomonas sp. Kb3]
MTSLVFVITMLVTAFIVFKLLQFVLDRARGFDDPTTMEMQHLVSAIAGQADWIEKMRSSPWETQQMSHIIKQTNERKNYIARLCVEIVSRDGVDGQFFQEAAQYAKELELSGIAKDKAATQAVKEKLFTKNGFLYPSSWDI